VTFYVGCPFAVETNLKLLHNGPEKQINIFVHGYGTLRNQNEFNYLAGRVLAAQPAGRVYLLFWKSGHWNPSLLTHVVTCGIPVLFRFAEFKFFELKAEELGRRFLMHLSKIPHAREYVINLIGYSLGARVVHYALASYDWSNYHIQDVILLAGAADAEDDDWPECADEVRGKIYNAWSPVDFVLKIKPDRRSAVGRCGIGWTYHKIVNRRYALNHGEYLDHLEYILSRLWPRFRQAKAPLVKDVECPYCGEVLEVFPPWDDSPIECEECGLDFEFNGKTVYKIENDIECPKCGLANTLLPEYGWVFYCDNCDARLWRYGDKGFT
jgi:pimeloyl-ACP methyl ester carboxylesterase